MNGTERLELNTVNITEIILNQNTTHELKKLLSWKNADQCLISKKSWITVK